MGGHIWALRKQLRTTQSSRRYGLGAVMQVHTCAAQGLAAVLQSGAHERAVPRVAQGAAVAIAAGARCERSKAQNGKKKKGHPTARYVDMHLFKDRRGRKIAPHPLPRENRAGSWGVGRHRHRTERTASLRSTFLSISHPEEKVRSKPLNTVARRYPHSQYEACLNLSKPR